MACMSYVSNIQMWNDLFVCVTYDIQAIAVAEPRQPPAVVGTIDRMLHHMLPLCGMTQSDRTWLNEMPHDSSWYVTWLIHKSDAAPCVASMCHDSMTHSDATWLILIYDIPHGNELDAATHCNTLQHTATHCNTLQHTADEWDAATRTTHARHDIQIFNHRCCHCAFAH